LENNRQIIAILPTSSSKAPGIFRSLLIGLILNWPAANSMEYPEGSIIL